MWILTISFSIFLITYSNFEAVSSLQCFECNTKFNKSCPFEETYLKDCPDSPDSEMKNQSLTGGNDQEETTTVTVITPPLSIENNVNEAEMNGTSMNTATNETPTTSTIMHVSEPAEEKVPVCMKTQFYSSSWFHYKTNHAESKKRMTKPRFHFSCGLVPKSKAGDICVSKNSIDIQQTQCICTSDKCNGSGILIASFYSFYVMVILVISVLSRSGLLV